MTNVKNNKQNKEKNTNVAICFALFNFAKNTFNN